MNDIIFKSLYKTEDGNNVKLCCDIVENETNKVCYYQVDKKYSEYLCDDRYDSFVIAFLLYAMENSKNIVCENNPISERLKYQIDNFIIPVISKYIDIYHSIEVHSDITNKKIECCNHTGTGISAGTDSWYTILKNKERNAIDSGVFLNVGSSPNEELNLTRLKRAKNICEDLNINLIWIDSNLDEFLGEEFVKSHTFRSVSAILSMQKYFGRYLFSSGVSFSEFKFIKDDCAYYDLFNCTFLSTDATTFYSFGGEAERYDKISYISKFDITYKYLNVCVHESENCGKCFKCVRTMMELYAEGSISNYANVFDIEYFEKNKNWYLINMIRNMSQDTNLKRPYKILKNQKKIPPVILIVGTLKRWKFELCKKIKRKRVGL